MRKERHHDDARTGRNVWARAGIAEICLAIVARAERPNNGGLPASISQVTRASHPSFRATGLPPHCCVSFPDQLVGHKGFLGEFEQTVLLAILQLNERAYAPNVARHLEDSVDRSVSRGALYSCLNQLERKGFLRWRLDEPTSERGGHARRFYQVTARGVRALRASREGQMVLWQGLESILGPAK